MSGNTELSARTPDVGTSWTKLISNGSDLRVTTHDGYITTESTGTDVGSLYQANATYSSADYQITGRSAYAASTRDRTVSYAIRIQDENNMYLARFGSGASGIKIYSGTSGTWTQLGSTSYTPVNDTSVPYNDDGDIIGIRAEGTSISALVNGSVALTVTDSDHSAAGVAGVGTGYVNVSTDDSGSGVGIDNIIVEDLSDETGPTMTITAAEGSDGFTSNNSTLSLTFTSSEATSNFAVGDITAVGGDLTSFAGSGAVYTATFTPTGGDGAKTIDVAANTFTDASSNNNSAATQFNWTYDTTPPTMTITAAEGADGFTSNDASLALTFTSSEATTDFAEEHITAVGGNLTSFAGSGAVYTATFTPTGGDGAKTIDVAANTFTDAANNDNTAATQFNWTLDGSVPTITSTTIAFDNSTIAVTFSEAVYNTTGGSGALETSDFALSISGGTATLSSTTPSSISISLNVYTLGVSLSGTPNGSETLTVVPSSATAIYDGGNNAASTTQSNNTVALNEKIIPTVTFSPINGATSVSQNGNITITFSEAVRNVDNTVLTDANVDALITLKKTDVNGAAIVFDATIDADKKVITINPASDFANSQVVYAAIGSTVEDAANNAIIATSVTFTAMANSAPVLADIGVQSTDEDVEKSITLSASDVDENTLTYSATSAEENVTASVSNTILTLTPVADWHGSANITAIVSDGSTSDSETFTLTVNPINDAPANFTVSTDSLSENSAVGTVVGIFSATDIDTGETFTYSLVAGDGSNDADNTLFSISGDTLKSAAIFDYEEQNSRIVRIQVQDIGGLSFVNSQTIRIINLPEPQLSITSSSIDFGQVIVTHDSSSTVSISSTGLDTLVIDSIKVNDQNYSVLSLAYPIKLAPQLTQDVLFTFSPVDTGSFNGVGTIYSNVANAEIQMTGLGINDTIPPVITDTSVPVVVTTEKDIPVVIPVSDAN
ncbi:MAG: Ig-like domain-containing protein, partial [Candidatus Marinimicrobia bacterium]|nr:Ig-like domain-containing protein [Candidatus Neomarinimicrobiota bacterium]